MLVVDSSVVISWLLDDEASPATDALAREVSLQGGWAPALLRTEVANGLVVAERRRRISPAELLAGLADFEDLSVQLENALDSGVMREVVLLAHSAGLTVYDATYLELALRLGAELLTLDTALANAARNLGAKVRP